MLIIIGEQKKKNKINRYNNNLTSAVHQCHFIQVYLHSTQIDEHISD